MADPACDGVDFSPKWGINDKIAANRIEAVRGYSLRLITIMEEPPAYDA
jgi:hypothetical protein